MIFPDTLLRPRFCWLLLYLAGSQASRKTDCPSLDDDPVGQGSKTQPTAPSSKTIVSCQPPVKLADSWIPRQVSNLVRLVLGNFIHSLTLTLGTASPTTTTLTRTIPRTKSLHGPSRAHYRYNTCQFHTCFFPQEMKLDPSTSPSSLAAERPSSPCCVHLSPVGARNSSWPQCLR